MVSAKAAFKSPQLAAVARPRIDWDVLGASLLINILGLALPLAMLQLFDRVIPNASSATLQAIFLLLCLVIICDCALKVMRHAIVLANGRRAESQLVSTAIDRLFDGDMSALEQLGREGVIERITSIQKLQSAGGAQTLTNLLDLAFSAIFLGAIAALTGPLVIIPITMITVVGILARRMRHHHRSAIARREDNDNRRMSFLIEVLSQVRLLKALSAEQRILRRYDTLHNSSAKANETLVKIADISFTMSAMLGQATTGLTSIVGAFLVVEERIGLADLAATILLTGRAVQPVVNAFFMDAEQNYLRQIMQKLDDLMIVPDAPGAYSTAPLGATAIRARQLVVPQLDGDPLLAPRIDIPRNAITTVTGERGALPGPFLRALAGEIRPEQGDIFIDTGPAEQRPLIGFLPDETQLLEGTFLENLTDFAGRMQIPERVACAEELGLMEDFGLIAGGLDSLFAGPGRGAGSPGFYKKLALATTLGRSPRILILESPYAQLDPTSGRRLTEVLSRAARDCTIIVSDPAIDLQAKAALRIQLHATAAATQEYVLRGGVKRQRGKPQRTIVVQRGRAAG